MELVRYPVTLKEPSAALEVLVRGLYNKGGPLCCAVLCCAVLQPGTTVSKHRKSKVKLGSSSNRVYSEGTQFNGKNR